MSGDAVVLLACAFQAGNEDAAINSRKRTGPRFVKSRSDYLNARPDYWPVDLRTAPVPQKDGLRGAAGFHVLVARQEYLKPLALYQLKQGAILHATPLHADNSVYLMPRQITSQLEWHILIEEHLHGCA